MAVDYFLAINGIQGESRDAQHAGEIELQSVSWGESAGAGPAAGGGGGAGKAHTGDLVFSAATGKASPPLMLACASGQHLKSAVLTCRTAGAAPQDFLVVRLGTVLVTSYAVEGTAGAAPLDRVSLGFGRIELEFRPQKDDGSLEAPVTAAWDVAQGRKG
jgi:type VI secretion system secreted protein Hcp